MITALNPLSDNSKHVYHFGIGVCSISFLICSDFPGYWYVNEVFFVF